MDDLARRIVVPDLLLPGPRPLVSTDGWAAYPNAVDGAFGGGVTLRDDNQGLHGVGTAGSLRAAVMTGAVRTVIQGNFKPMGYMHVPRRKAQPEYPDLPPPLHRLALGFSKKLECLHAAIALYVAHYNFCHPHGSLLGTPAMAAKLTGHPWALESCLVKRNK